MSLRDQHHAIFQIKIAMAKTFSSSLHMLFFIYHSQTHTKDMTLSLLKFTDFFTWDDTEIW